LTGARMLRQERSHLLGRPFLFNVANSHAFLQHLSRCRLDPDDVISELELRRPGGQTLPVEIRSRVAMHGGRMLFRSAFSDLTERRRAEPERQALARREQKARQANEAKDRFLAVLGHELRNPLAAIAASASVLVDAEIPGELADAVERIRRNVSAE